MLEKQGERQQLDDVTTKAAMDPSDLEHKLTDAEIIEKLLRENWLLNYRIRELGKNDPVTRCARGEAPGWGLHLSPYRDMMSGRIRRGQQFLRRDRQGEAQWGCKCRDRGEQRS